MLMKQPLEWVVNHDGSEVAEAPEGRYRVFQKAGRWVLEHPHPDGQAMELGGDNSKEFAKGVAEGMHRDAPA